MPLEYISIVVYSKCYFAFIPMLDQTSMVLYISAYHPKDFSALAYLDQQILLSEALQRGIPPLLEQIPDFLLVVIVIIL